MPTPQERSTAATDALRQVRDFIAGNTQGGDRRRYEQQLDDAYVQAITEVGGNRPYPVLSDEDKARADELAVTKVRAGVQQLGTQIPTEGRRRLDEILGRVAAANGDRRFILTATVRAAGGDPETTVRNAATAAAGAFSQLGYDVTLEGDITVTSAG